MTGRTRSTVTRGSGPHRHHREERRQDHAAQPAPVPPVCGEIKNHPNLKLATSAGIGLNPAKTAPQEIMFSPRPRHFAPSRRLDVRRRQCAEKVSVGRRKSRVLASCWSRPRTCSCSTNHEPSGHGIHRCIEAIDVFDGAVIIVTHSELMLHALATRLIVYDNDTISLFEGTYSDFLERVGWGEEGGPKKKKQKKNADKSANAKGGRSKTNASAPRS
jgi:hypothetical protein